MRWQPTLRWPRRLLRAKRASVALEFALTGPIVLLFLGGAADFGYGVYCRGRLAAAVSVGAEYAVLKGSGVSQSDIATLVANASRLSLPANDPTVTVSTYCVENSPPTLVATASNTTCPDGSTPQTYAIITATYSPALFIPLDALSGGINITESATAELQ